MARNIKLKRKVLVFLLLISMLSGYVLPCLAYSNPGGFASSSAEIAYTPYVTPPDAGGSTPTTEVSEATEEWVYHEYVRWIEGHVYEDDGNSSELVTPTQKPVPGVLVGTTTSSNFKTITDKNGFYKMDLSAGNYKVNFKYGDLAALDSRYSSLNSELTIGDIMKYNGHDYSVSDFSEATIYDYSVIRREIIDSGKGASQVFLLIDASYSMKHTNVSIGGVVKTKLQHAIDSAKVLISDLLAEGDNIYIGIVAYAGNCYRAAGLTKDEAFLMDILDDIPNKPDNTWAGGTDIKQALIKAEQSFYIDESDPDYLDHCNRSIVIVSDGIPTSVNGPEPPYGDFIYIGQDPTEAFNVLINRVGPQTREEIEKLKNDEKINIMTLISDTNDPDEVEFLNSVYDGCVDLFKIAEDEEDLARIIKEDIKEWIIDQLEEVTVFNNNSQVITGAEDSDRREEVDNLFNYKFFYDANLTLSEEKLSPKTVIFKKALNATTKTTDVETLAAKTSMTAHTTEAIHIDPPPSLFALVYENRDEVETRTRADGSTYEVTVHHRIVEVGATLDMYLQRRQEFPLRTDITATGLRIILNDGEVLSVQTKDFGDATPIMEVIDDDIAHGATIEVEYTIRVKNNSSLQCNHLELLAYVPEEFIFSPERDLITEKGTNKKYSWSSNKMESLHTEGYIEDEAFKEYGEYQIQGAVCVLDNEGKGQDGFFIAPGGEYTTKLVVTRVVSNAEDVPNTINGAVEVMGYKNNGNRRMTFANTNEDPLTGSVINALEGYYPGDVSDVDYSVSTNPVFVLPPTGSKE